MSETKAVDVIERPDSAQRIAMLTQHRDNFKNQGYLAEIESMALDAQKAKFVVVDGRRITLQARREELEENKRNCYLAARRLDEEIKLLKETEAASSPAPEDQETDAALD